LTEAERIAAEAKRLLAEPLLAEALDAMLSDAFAEFKALRIAPETMTDVIALQQRVNVIQEIPDLIGAKILASGQYDGGVDVEKKPTA
jgi:hypothetical protein